MDPSSSVLAISPWGSSSSSRFSNSGSNGHLNPASPGMVNHFSNFSPHWNISPHSAPSAVVNNNEILSLREFRERYRLIQKSEQSKDTLIEDLIIRMEQMCRADPNATNYLVAAQRESMLNDKMQRMQRLMDRDPFVLVLVDANKYMFDLSLMKYCEDGGRSAAHKLYKAVHLFLDQNRPEIPREGLRVAIRIYADLEQLTAKCTQAGFVEQSADVTAFLKGLVDENPLFDFVDVSTASIENKLLESFNMHIFDFHCRQVIVDSSHRIIRDRIEEVLRNDRSANRRITVLPELTDQSDLVSTNFNGFLQTIPRLFIPSPPVSEDPHPYLSPAQVSVVGSGYVKPSPSTSWATAATNKQQTPLPPSPASSTIDLKSLPTETATTSAPRNRLNQRVDPLIVHNKDEVDRVKRLKICNTYFLRSSCPYGDKCTHNHKYKPTKNELQTLRLVARMAPCKEGSSCDDTRCIYGHICPAPTGKKGEHCIFGDKCRFPPELHGIDRTVVRTIKIG